MRPITLLLFAIACMAQAPPPQRPPLPPVPPASALLVPFATPTSATLIWVSDAPAVSYGPTGKEATAKSFRVEKTVLTNLAPGSVIHYDIPGAGSGEFTTPPAPGTAGNYTFVVFGENRTRFDVYRQVAKEIAAVKPTFVVHTGDLVENGRNPDLWSIFFDISRDMLKNTVFFTSLGNHEGNTPFWYQFFDQPTGYYSFDWGKTHWTVLNTNNVQPDPEAYWARQMDFLERDLAKNQDADFLFVAFHHTPYTAVRQRWESAAKIAERLVPVFKKYKISAVFAGHDHNYQHHEKDGIPYIVTGGGGAPLYEVDGMMEITKVAEKVENFVVCRTVETTIHCDAKALGGRVIDKLDFAPRKTAR